MIVQGVRMRYRCRLCGKVFFDAFDEGEMGSHAPADRLLNMAIKNGAAKIGVHHESMIIDHCCGKNKRGVADLIGFAPVRGSRVTV